MIQNGFIFIFHFIFMKSNGKYHKFICNSIIIDNINEIQVFELDEHGQLTKKYKNNKQLKFLF